MARNVLRIVSGNFLEMYDSMVFGASATRQAFIAPKPLPLPRSNRSLPFALAPYAVVGVLALGIFVTTMVTVSR